MAIKMINSITRSLFGAIILLLFTQCDTKSIHSDDNINIKVAAAAEEIVGDDSMDIGGSIHPGKASGQEGKLRATAVVIEGNHNKLCIVSCDVLMFGRDIIDDVSRRIEAECGIPFGNILISATHTHSAPTTATVHGYSRDETFIKRLKEAIFLAVSRANDRLKELGNAEMYFWLGQESTVGHNSRFLLSDSTIYWTGPMDDAIRPTGTFDPELPVIAFKGENEILEAVLFNHSTHNIGGRKGGVRSPAFYGLAAQELEEKNGGKFLFLLGAAGSVHDYRISPDERILRIKDAVTEALEKAQRREVSRLISVKDEFEYYVREFNDAKEDEAVSYYCKKRLSNRDPDSIIEVFRNMRKELIPHQGELRKTWLQVMVIGDVAIVGVSGELFNELGIEIKRRSPFRYTYIVELANDYIGYIPDKKGFELGGYQVWTGFHSFIAKGTGEAIVDRVTGLLKDIHNQK